MDELMLYLVKVASAHVVLFLIYHILLRKGTHFRMNRRFLLATILIPFIIPLITLGATSYGMVGFASVMLEQITVGMEPTQEATGSAFAILYLVAAVYLTGVGYMMIRNIRQILIINKIHKTSCPQLIHGHTIRITKGHLPACSFFQNIYVDEETATLDGIGKIILHEQVHVKQLHSLDVILAELLCMLFWFNPISWMIRKALKEVHEYQADSGVKGADPDTAGYFSLLANHIVGIQPTFSNQFNQSLTLKRLKMMTKNRSGRFASMKALLGIPLLLLLVVAFSGRNPAGALIALNDAASAVPGHEQPMHASSSRADITSNTPPQYPGGDEAMMKFMKENMRYPETARKAGTEGVVYVQFVVTAKGNITSVKVKRSVEASLDAEAVRVVSMMPDWIPGQQDGKPVDVEMVLPVNFKLERKTR